ncbi:hypothetical protein DY000_02031482 [Brassica cretica]|uniref:Uncharacterized protein n=1 Tax=Brassica cretica TaxID=69181 RepID=A0ABQ7DPX9_BRACR|nr:hypothetical protein DY000_02031482 [Brassica cretica]
MDSRRIDVSEELGRYVATELGSSSVARSVVLTSSRQFLTPPTWRPRGNKTSFICIKLSRDISVHAWSLRSDRAWLVDHRSILERNNRSILTYVYRSTAKRTESPFGHSQLEAQVFTILQDYS